MSQLVPLIVTIVMVVIIARRMRPREGWFASTAKSYRKRPVATVIWLVLPVALLVGLVFGPHYLAEQIYDTPSPTRAQVRTARLIIGSPIVVPFLGFMVWAFWTQRKADRHMRGRADHTFDDPSKRSVREEIN